MNEIKYFPYALKSCPYCKSEDVSVPSLVDHTLRIMGAHAYASMTCNSCKKEWETGNETQINWQIPTKKTKKIQKNIIVGVSGGIAAYKACDLISILRKSDFDVRVIMTEHAKQFITPLTLATLSRHPIMDDMWKERDGSVEHIEVTKWCDIFVVYPATVNVIAKFAHGIADDLLSTVYLALPKNVKKIIFPAANTNMVSHAATIRNMGILKSDGCFISDTRETELACGDVGKGALLKPRDAAEIIMSEYKIEGQNE